MTKTQKAVGILAATGITLFTFTTYYSPARQMGLSGAPTQTQLQPKNSTVASPPNKVQKNQTAATDNPSESKYTPGYNNPMQGN